MKPCFGFLGLLLLSTLSISAVALAQQQVTGTPGAPDATSTIDPQSLPAPPPGFGGSIGLDAEDSTPWWPPTVVPPEGPAGAEPSQGPGDQSTGGG